MGSRLKQPSDHHQRRDGLRQPHRHPDRRLRPSDRSGVGTLVGSAQARALTGCAGSNRRRVERGGAPPGYPATVEKHALTPGGEVTYSMIGPEGDQHRGMWRVTSVDTPTSRPFTDKLADSYRGLP